MYLRYIPKCIGTIAFLLFLNGCKTEVDKPAAQSTPPPVQQPAPGDPEPPQEPVPVNGQVLVMWEPPQQRENGTSLAILEVGGFEIRYKSAMALNFNYLLIDNRWETSYTFENLVGDYQFEIAAFDTNGLYSQFVPLKTFN